MQLPDTRTPLSYLGSAVVDERNSTRNASASVLCMINRHFCQRMSRLDDRNAAEYVRGRLW